MYRHFKAWSICPNTIVQILCFCFISQILCHAVAWLCPSPPFLLSSFVSWYDSGRTEEEVYFYSPVGLTAGSHGAACLFPAAAVTCPHKQQTATRNLEILLFTSCFSLLYLPVSILLVQCLFLGKTQLAFALKRLEWITVRCNWIN